MPKRCTPKPHRQRLICLILAIVMAISLGMSAWLVLAPIIKKQADEGAQAELLASIEQDIAVITTEETLAPDAPQDDLVWLPQTYTDITEPELPDLEPEPPKEPAPLGTELGILTIDSIDLRLPVIEGATEELLKIAVGHVPETVTIGDIGNAVIAGHRSYTYGKDFNRLGEIVVGDIIGYTTSDGEVMRFEVFELLVIEPDDQSAFNQPQSKSIITLYTCTPIRTATHRLLVRAIQID